jgi:hypothetical protein
LCYWSERVKDFDEFLEEECEAFHGNDELRQKLKKHGWIRKSAMDLAEEMHWAMQGRTIQRYLLKLVNLKLVDRRRQQNPKYKFDRSCEYRVNFCELQRQLKRIGYNLSDYRVTECFDNDAESTGQNDSWSSNSDQSVGSSDQTITEIRTENNLKNTIESSAESSAPLSHSTDSSPDLFPPDQITADAKASIATAQQVGPPMHLKTSKPRVAKIPPPTEYPPALDCPAFRTAWEEFLQHRKEKKTPVTPTAQKNMFRKFVSWGTHNAIDAIDTSISNGWTGVFEPNAKKKTGLNDF